MKMLSKAVSTAIELENSGQQQPSFKAQFGILCEYCVSSPSLESRSINILIFLVTRIPDLTL